jgi:hypothetical protein
MERTISALLLPRRSRTKDDDDINGEALQGLASEISE